MSEIIRNALRSLARKRFRTGLVVAAIAIGVASVVLIMTIGETGKAAVNAELDSLGLGSLSISADSRIGRTSLEADEIAVISALEPVGDAVPIMVEYSNITMRQLVAEAVVWGVDSGTDQVISLSCLFGRMIQKPDILGAENVCLVDASVAEAFYQRENIVGKTIRILFDSGYEDFEIVGVVESGGNVLQSIISEYLPTFVYIPYTTMQVLAGRTSFDQAAVQIKENEDIDAAGETISRALYQYSGVKNGFRIDNVSRQKESLNELLNIVTVVLSLIAGISLIVAGLGIMTVMLVSVSERTREIGIKKSIGATVGVIMTEFLAEAFTISFIGSIIGSVLGAVIAFIGCAIFKMDMRFSWEMTAFSVVFAVVTGVLFGVYPSAKAARLDPVEALRRE